MATIEQMIQRLCAANWTIQIHTDGWNGSGEYVVMGYPAGHASDVWEFAAADALADALADFAAMAIGNDGTEDERQEQGGYTDLPEISAAGQRDLNAWHRAQDARRIVPEPIADAPGASVSGEGGA